LAGSPHTELIRTSLHYIDLRAWSRANGFFRNKTDAKNALRYVPERRKKHGEEILTKPMDKPARLHRSGAETL
jgi:hypothetical protein